jgi:hypothetical protein
MIKRESDAVQGFSDMWSEESALVEKHAQNSFLISTGMNESKIVIKKSKRDSICRAYTTWYCARPKSPNKHKAFSSVWSRASTGMIKKVVCWTYFLAFRPLVKTVSYHVISLFSSIRVTDPARNSPFWHKHTMYNV